MNKRTRFVTTDAELAGLAWHYLKTHNNWVLLNREVTQNGHTKVVSINATPAVMKGEDSCNVTT